MLSCCGTTKVTGEQHRRLLSYYIIWTRLEATFDPRRTHRFSAQPLAWMEVDLKAMIRFQMKSPDDTMCELYLEVENQTLSKTQSS